MGARTSRLIAKSAPIRASTESRHFSQSPDSWAAPPQREPIEIATATSCPRTTCPKSVYFPSRWLARPTVIKNWHEPELGFPVFAIPSVPGLSKLTFGLISSGRFGTPQSLDPRPFHIAGLDHEPFNDAVESKPIEIRPQDRLAPSYPVSPSCTRARATKFFTVTGAISLVKQSHHAAHRRIDNKVKSRRVRKLHRGGCLSLNKSSEVTPPKPTAIRKSAHADSIFPGR